MSAGSGLALGRDTDSPRVRFQGLATTLGRDCSGLGLLGRDCSLTARTPDPGS
jgi:hypothetical protein